MNCFQQALQLPLLKPIRRITQSWSDGWGQEWEGKDPNDKTDFSRFVSDEGLGETAGFNLYRAEISI